MDLLLDALKTLGLLLGTVIVIFLVPLLFMVVISLATGFDERVPGDD